MASVRTIPIPAGTDLQQLMGVASQNLMYQGYGVMVQPMGPWASMMTVTKNRDGFANIMGLGVECRATATITAEGVMNVSVESEWTNKILACAIGWILCTIPLITGIVGCVTQSELPSKIFTALSAASASGGSTPYHP